MNRRQDQGLQSPRRHDSKREDENRFARQSEGYPQQPWNEDQAWKHGDQGRDARRRFMKHNDASGDAFARTNHDDVYHTSNYGTSADQFGGSYSGDRYSEQDPRSRASESRPRTAYQDHEPRASDYRGRGPKGYQRSDQRIQEEACDRLSEDPMVDASNLEVTCSGGVVILQGSVDSRAMKRRAEGLVESCGGVKDVHNRLTISAGLGGADSAQDQGLDPADSESPASPSAEGSK